MQKGFYIFLILIFLVLPTVSASSFITDSFIDYGKDIDGDGLFNYLSINVTVSIDKVRNHTLYASLKDSSDNLLEYSKCMELTPNKYNFSLDFSGIKIYRNKVDGPYTLSEIKLFSMASCKDIKDVIEEDSLTNAHITNPYSYTEFQKGKAAIECNNSPCIANSNLISSRDNLDIPEPSAPNTIDGCEDGSSGSYLNDESIENITVTSLNHSFFKIGDTIKVDIWVYCDSLSDKLNFVYSNNASNIQWQVKDNANCTSIDLEKISTTFKLDSNIGKHAIRGVFDIGLDQNSVCEEDYYADNDDVVIYVTDYQEPQEGYSLNLTQGWNLLSLPKITNNDITAIADIFNNDFESIITLKNNKYYLYDKSVNSNLNELSEANGFWIKMNNNQSVLIDNESTQYIDLNLTKGWNLIGYPSLREKEANELFENVMDDIELIYIYNNQFYSFNPQNPFTLIIKPGTGIFVKAKTNTNWNFNGTYNKNQTEEPPDYFDLNLSEGWNLISIPITSEKTINDIFGSNKLYYLENNIWKQLSNSDKINYSHSYWIKTAESSIYLEGNNITSLNFNIQQGWNMINYPIAQETSTNIFFSNVMANIVSIATFEDGEWKTYIPSKQLNSLTILKPGKGIFIKAKNNANWNFDGNELVAT